MGNGKKSCLKRHGDCNTRAHRNTVDLVHEQCLLIRAGEGANAFTRPSLDTSKLKDLFIQNILNCSEPDWAKVFGFLAENNITDTTQEMHMCKLTTDVKAQIMPRTPACRKTNFFTEEAANDLFIGTVGLRSYLLKTGTAVTSYKRFASKLLFEQEDSGKAHSLHDDLIAK